MDSRCVLHIVSGGIGLCHLFAEPASYSLLLLVTFVVPGQ